jgi:hypothetical protein
MDLPQIGESAGHDLRSRNKGERQRTQRIDGRTLRRAAARTRDVSVIFKTTPAKREQLDNLADRLDTTFVDVFERALDALERELMADGETPR